MRQASPRDPLDSLDERIDARFHARCVCERFAIHSEREVPDPEPLVAGEQGPRRMARCAVQSLNAAPGLCLAEEAGRYCCDGRASCFGAGADGGFSEPRRRCGQQRVVWLAPMPLAGWTCGGMGSDPGTAEQPRSSSGSSRGAPALIARARTRHATRADSGMTQWPQWLAGTAWELATTAPAGH